MITGTSLAGARIPVSAQQQFCGHHAGAGYVDGYFPLLLRLCYQAGLHSTTQSSHHSSLQNTACQGGSEAVAYVSGRLPVHAVSRSSFHAVSTVAGRIVMCVVQPNRLLHYEWKGLVWASKWWPDGAGATRKTTFAAGIVIKSSGNAPGIVVC